MVSIRKEAIENFVMSEIAKVVKSEEFISNILDRFVEFYNERNSNNELIKNLERQLETIERKIGNLTKIIVDAGKFNDIFEAELNSLTDEKAKILENLKRESTTGFTEFVTKETIRRTYFRVLKLLETGETQDKETIINTLLNRVIVYKDRVEIFINILPYEDYCAELKITDEDLTAYDLLETTENKKIAL